MAVDGPLYIGFDLSTQQLKAIVVDSNLKLIHEAKVDFDEDLSNKYGVQKGVLTNPTEGEVFAPPIMWLDAVNLVLDRLRDAGHDFARVKGISGAGMQHGTVFWSRQAEELLKNLDAGKTLAEQLEPGQLLTDLGARKTVHQQLEPDAEEAPRGAFAHPVSPNWQDASTQQQCDEFDLQLGDAATLADVTGSKAHHRFSGPQILRYRTRYPQHYRATARISLVSSFLASVFLGRIAPIDVSDVTGMNLWDLNAGTWDERLLTLTAGRDAGAVAELEAKLGPVSTDGGAAFGPVSPYFVTRYRFAADCQVLPFTGDNPATILALPLRASDAIVSLGTSTTFLMSTPTYKPDPAYHFMNHPTTPGLYMFMLCYKNGGLAREEVRDYLNSTSASSAPSSGPNAISSSSSASAAPGKGSWDRFNETALATPPLAQKDSPSSPMKLGLYFPRPEIVPNLPAGQWRRAYDPEAQTLSPLAGGASASSSSSPRFEPSDARAILESQFLSLRLRSRGLLAGTSASASTSSSLPAQPRRVYLVGGGSVNAAIARVAGQVLGPAEGVYRLDIGGNACALGAAYKAVWGRERDGDEAFEDLIGARWDEGAFVERIADGYDADLFARYGDAVEGFEMLETEILREVGRKG